MTSMAPNETPILNSLRRRAARAIECFVLLNLLHIAVALISETTSPPAASATMVMGLTFMAALTVGLLLLAQRVRSGRSIGVTLAILSWLLAAWIVVIVVLLASGDYPATRVLQVVQLLLVASLAMAWFLTARLIINRKTLRA